MGKDEQANEPAPLLRLSGEDAITFVREWGGTKTHEIKVRFRVPTTSERNRFLATSNRLLAQATRLAQDEDATEEAKEAAARAMLDYRTDTILPHVLDVEGIAIPEESSATEELRKGGHDILDALLRHAYESGNLLRPDLGKPAKG